MWSANRRLLSGKRSSYSKPFAALTTLAWVLAFSGQPSLTSAETLIAEGDAWRYWFGPYAATMARAPMFPALGNHDIWSENGRWFRKYFHLPENGPSDLKERCYSLDYGNVHVAVIDSNPFNKNNKSDMKDNVHSFVLVDIQGDELALKGIDEDGKEIDALHLALDHPFAMDGILHDSSWKRSSHGLNLYAAIRGDTLYVAMQDAGEGSDHFIFLADSPGPPRQTCWNKRGGVMTWSAFLADEDGNGFHGWFDGNETRLKDPLTYKSMTPVESKNAGTAAVLEGTIDLKRHFGEIPQHLFITAAPYKSPDRGHLVAAAQVPSGDNDSDLEESEFLRIRSQDLVLDFPSPD